MERSDSMYRNVHADVCSMNSFFRRIKLKIVSSLEMQNIEAQAFKKYGDHLREIFMEQAGKNIAYAVAKHLEEKNKKHSQPEYKKVTFLCGKGNNGGDAYVCARYLLQMGFQTEAVVLDRSEDKSPACRENADRYHDLGGKSIFYKELEQDYFHANLTVIDGLLGTGFYGNLRENYRELIERVNQSPAKVLAIDIPSGLQKVMPCTAIKAEKTFSLGLPKSIFFYQNSKNFTGRIENITFGLQDEFIQIARSEGDYITEEDCLALLPKIDLCRHKYEAGTACLWAGSQGMTGAALLAAEACMRMGSGMTNLIHSATLKYDLSNRPQELLTHSYAEENFMISVDHEDQGLPVHTFLNKAHACLLGPGLSSSRQSTERIKNLVPKLEVPSVLDAQVLNAFAQSNFHLPQQCVLTPHEGELKRLLNIPERFHRSEENYQLCQNFVNQHKVTLLVKGAPNIIFHPHTLKRIINRGDPGMATAGSGDVLAGMIVSLLAQGLKPFDAASLACYLHGMAGEYASMEKTPFALIASDIIELLPLAIKQIGYANP